MSRRLLLVLATVSVAISACSTKTYVQQQTEASRQATDAKVEELRRQIESNQAAVAALRRELAKRDEELAKLADTSREPLKRAEEAGRLAKPCPWSLPGEFCQAEFPLDIVMTDWADITDDIALAERGFSKLQDVTKLFVEAMHRAGFSKGLWYTVPGVGFAVVTDYEKIDRHGRRISTRGGSRADLESGDSPLLWLFAHLGAVPPDEGYFRAFALVVTDKPFGRGEEVSPPDLDRDMVPGGGMFLPARLEEQSLSAQHHCIVMLFEFHRPSQSGPTELRRQKLVPVRTHLDRAGLLAPLQRRSQ